MMANFSVPYIVNLSELLPGVALSSSPIITGLDSDSRNIQPGDLFFAYAGDKQDGRQFIDDAVLRGAAAVCYEQKKSGFLQDKYDCVEVHRQQMPLIAIENLSQQISLISARYFHTPAQKLRCIGVTGTNGKTSCSWWLTQSLRSLGATPGLIGTLGYGVWKNEAAILKETGFTTPDAILTQKILFEFAEQKATHAVMEVSSHSLDQGRVNAVDFSTALFTNLSRDHLDYHGSMEVYGAAKAKLFSYSSLRNAVINKDDSFGASLATRLKEQLSHLRVITFGLADAAADINVEGLQRDENGFRGLLNTPWGTEKLDVAVTGDFNLSNLLGVIGVLCAEGFELAKVIDTLRDIPSPPGRLEEVVANTKGDIRVWVDFAHTPDALEKVLSTLCHQRTGKLWCVFGCGGDRDAGKRPLMGEVVSRLADHCVVTSDNPRSENPQEIIKQITATMDASKLVIKVDRQEAIEYAISSAQAGDAILIAGKGHEKYQECNGTKYLFDDVAQAKQALHLRLARRQS